MGAPPRRETIDWFAIKFAVREQRPMNLRSWELTIAIKLLLEKGFWPHEIIPIVGCDIRTVDRAKNKPWPVPRESVPDSVVGEKKYRAPTAWNLTRQEARQITGF